MQALALKRCVLNFAVLANFNTHLFLPCARILNLYEEPLEPVEY